MCHARRSLYIRVFLCALFSILSRRASATNFSVTVFTDTNSGGLAGTGTGTPGDLRAQILAANASAGADTITFACGSPPCAITLTGPLPPITDSLSINGGSLGSIAISGAGAYRVFFIDAGTVVLQNLVIQNGVAQGGAGGTGDGGGGGGAGLGGGLFVNQAGAAVTLTNVHFLNCAAIGGAGANFISMAFAGGGGGGLAFRGGNSSTNGGGAGGGGVLGAGTNVTTGNSGGNGGAGGGGGGGIFNSGVGVVPGSGGSGYASNPGGFAGIASTAGAGGFGGGGGGSALGTAGAGGFGGGGGGTGTTSRAGNGGPGGGGGGAGGGVGLAGEGGSLGSGMKGGDGGAPGAGGGGGGAAVGPDVFVNAGSLTVTNCTDTGSTATAGAGGTVMSFGATNGAAGTANSTPLYNYAGIVNGSPTTGPRAEITPSPIHFAVSTPASATAGSAFSFTVTALDQINNTVTGYSGTVHFTSSDGTATLPANSTLTNGVGTFSATLRTAGGQTITATDTVTSSITGTSNPLTVPSPAVPALSEWGLAVLAVLLMAAGVWGVRKASSHTA